MIAHQYKIRLEKSKTDSIDFTPEMVSLNNCEVKLIDKQTASNLIIDYEWLKSMPFASRYFFGIYFNVNNKKILGGALVFGDDYAENTDVWDKYGYKNKILLLSRGVCLWWTPKNTASYFISRASKWIKNNTKYRILTATVDPAAGEIGTIYQSLNWHYVGLMSGNYYHNREVKRFSVIINGKLRGSRWVREKLGTIKKEEILKNYPDAKFVNQYRKRRYFLFMDSKNNNKKYYKAIEHMIQPYPKRVDDEIVGIIYKITNKINGLTYIGQTTRSFNDRINDYRRGYGNDYLNKAFNKYGWDNFEFKIIDSAKTMDELNSKEIKYIAEFKSNDKNFGYNIESGGNNTIPTQETLNKMSIAHSGTKQTDNWVNSRIAKAGTEEAKKYGRPKTEEDKLYLSQNSPKYWLGKERDEETRKKISDTKKLKGPSDKQKEAYFKKVYKKNAITGEIVKIYESTGDASKYEDVNQSTISRWCKDNKIIKDYLWTYDIDFFKKKEVIEKIEKKPTPPKKIIIENHNRITHADYIESVSKKVIKYDKTNKLVLEKYNSLADAGKYNRDGLSYTQINRKCLGLVKNEGDVVWCYEEDMLIGNFPQSPVKNDPIKTLDSFNDHEMEIMYGEYKSGTPMREISRNHNITFSTLQKFISNKDGAGKCIIDKDMVAICKKTGKVFNDSINKSGCLTNHIKELYPDMVLPSKFLRKKVEIETGKPWYYEYFEFKQE